jgi:predicted transcriptional regulator
MGKKSNSQQIIYEFVCENPGLSTYEISKRLNMSGGKVRFALSRLKNMGLVDFKWLRTGNPRIKKLTFPVNAFKLLPKSLKGSLKKAV